MNKLFFNPTRIPLTISATRDVSYNKSSKAYITKTISASDERYLRFWRKLPLTSYNDFKGSNKEISFTKKSGE